MVKSPDCAAAMYARAISFSHHESMAAVTPTFLYSPHAYLIAAMSLSIVLAGAKFRTRAIADGSRKVPFGDPSLRLAMVPPSGSDVALVIPESSRALLLTQIVW